MTGGVWIDFRRPPAARIIAALVSHPYAGTCNGTRFGFSAIVVVVSHRS